VNDTLYKMLKTKNFVLNNYIIKVIVELKLDINDALLLIYFDNQDNPSLNMDKIKENLYLDEESIMESFTKLNELNLVEVKVIKNKNGVREEVINIDNVIKHISTDITKSTIKENKDNLFETFESEFGRTLSSTEFQIIDGWLNEGYSEEIIKEALKEAIYNNAKSLRYISKILISWKENGYNTVDDIRNAIKKESNDNILEDLFDYDWLDDKDE